MANKYCVANWKMNFTAAEGSEFIHALNIKDLNNTQTQIILCPAFTSLFSMVSEAKDGAVAIGAQNMYHEDSGAYTGEVSASMLNETNIKYVILGHSERRHIFGETDEMINLKMHQALNNKIIPILCIGETIEERESNNTFSVLESQLKKGLNNINGECLIAYEPVWAIGTGLSATAHIVNETHGQIRSILSTMGWNNDKCPLLYGGSVSPDNAKELSAIENVDGFLIGGASLDVEKFYKIYLEL